jgi:MFS superfamily sulfate permease-like transporter
MLAVVGTIESLLSARAIDALDPWRRRPDLSRDLLSTGVGNLVASSIGGLPMISEVVRSSANVAAGGRSRWANAFHGAFLLLFVVLLPIVINRIPLAALAVMLVHTAARLASPGAFRAVRAIGPEQSAVFATTLLTTLASDLLIGVVVGLIMNALLCVGLGAPLRSLVRASVDVEPCDGGAVVHVRDAAVFANFLALRRAIPARPGTTVRIDFSTARVVDHTTLDRLDALRSQLATLGVHVTIAGLDDHRPISSHPLAARRRCA